MVALTAKQKAFVLEYLCDLNATQAAIRAGYSERTAEVQASRQLSKVNVQAAIQEALQAREKRTLITQDRVLAELGKIGFSDLKDFMEFGPDGVSLKQDADVDGAVVAEVSETATQLGSSKKIKLHDKMKALELLARHMGMLNDRLSITGEVQYEIKKPEGL